MKTNTESLLLYLADRYITMRLLGNISKVESKWLILDGRQRAKIWKQLIDKGYLKNADEHRADLTSKAFDDVETAPFNLADFYEYDSYDSDNGEVYVVWDRLDLKQKKAIILALEANPLSYTLLAVGNYNKKDQLAFNLGDKASGFGQSRFLAVTDATVTEKHAAAEKERKRQHYLTNGLNWYLQSVGVLKADEKVPLAPKRLLLGQGPALASDPNKWATDLLDTIAKTEKEVEDAKQRLANLKALHNHVCVIGVDANKGTFEDCMEAFVAKYRAAIEEQVNKTPLQQAAEEAMELARMQQAS